MVAVVEVLHDITERKRMDDLIRTQRDLGLALSNASGLEETLQLCLDAACFRTGLRWGLSGHNIANWVCP